MTAREHAEELRQHAIQTLLDERKAIDGMLRTLSYEEAAPAEKRRGRQPRQQEGGEISATTPELGEPNDSGAVKQAMPAVAQAER